MKHRHSATPFLAILLTVIATSAVWAFVVNRPASSQPVAQTPSTDMRPTVSTLVSQSGAVTIAYVEPLRPEFQRFDGVDHLPMIDAVLSTREADYHPPNYSQEGIVMVSHDDSLSGEACFMPPVETGAWSGTKTLGGDAWNVATYSDAGAGNRYDITLYRTMSGGTCYQIATTLHSSSDWTDVDMDAIGASQKAMQALLDQAALSVSLK